jgi:uncharacterized protein
MKPSRYNFIWPSDDPQKVILFNSFTTALAEVGRVFAPILECPQIDYQSLSPAVQAFVDRLKPGGFVIDDDIDELALLKFAWDRRKYQRQPWGSLSPPRCCATFPAPTALRNPGKGWDGAQQPPKCRKKFRSGCSTLSPAEQED